MSMSMSRVSLSRSLVGEIGLRLRLLDRTYEANRTRCED